MQLKQEAWVLYLRALNINGELEIVPFWGQVGELKAKDVLWSGELNKFFCIEKFHKDLDMFVIDEFIVGTPEEKSMKEIENKIIELTEKMFKESDFNTVGKKTKRGFRKNSIIYLSSIPNCIKNKFGIN